MEYTIPSNENLLAESIVDEKAMDEYVDHLLEGQSYHGLMFEYFDKHVVKTFATLRSSATVLDCIKQ